MTAAANKAKPAVSKELAALIAGQDGNATIFWCNATAPLPFFKTLMGLSSPYGNLGKPDALHCVEAIRLGEELDFQATYTMKDADGANSLGFTIDEKIKIDPILQLYLKAPECDDLIKEVNKTLSSKVNGRDVTVTATVRPTRWVRISGTERCSA